MPQAPDLTQHAVLTPRQMAEVDRLAEDAGLPTELLMENAGRACARAIRARFSPRRTLVLCGPGSNGGDGYVCARLLAQIGWPVGIAATAAPKKGTAAALAASRWRGPSLRFGARAASRADLVIDAVFGAGLSRDVDGVTAEALAAARNLVAIDVPSGLDGETGAVRGFAPQAGLTITFVRPKPGHLLQPGRALCGELVVADIGMPARLLARVKPSILHNHPDLWVLPALSYADHKYSRGTVTIAGGPMAGAARLAAMAARRAGAGLVAIATEASGMAYLGMEPGTVLLTEKLHFILDDPRRQVWVCGPGLGLEQAARSFKQLVSARRTVVADADALSAFAGTPAELKGAAVLTPHEGEFTRVFGAIGADRVAAVRAAARAVEAVVVLKGSSTLIASPDGRVAINTNAPPSLATAGTGDILAGIIGARLAQGLGPFEAAASAVWAHGEAGRKAGADALAEDILAALA